MESQQHNELVTASIRCGDSARARSTKSSSVHLSMKHAMATTKSEWSRWDGLKKAREAWKDMLDSRPWGHCSSVVMSSRTQMAACD